jgi:hypothetical protein
MEPFPEPHELLGFFEAEPSISDRDVPWFYNRLTYETVRGDNRIHCWIEPGYGQLCLIWIREEALVARLELDDIASLHVESERGVERLVAKFGSTNILDFEFQLKPTIQIRWGTKRVP